MSELLCDIHGRDISYLRVSLTEKCNFQCQYCSIDGESNAVTESELTSDELITVLEAMATLGVNKIRLTGGEPMLRPDIVELVRRISAIKGNRLIGLTTNGFLLARKLPELLDAGLNRLNISLDSINRENFHKITKRDGLQNVLNAIDIAEQSGAFNWVKVNVVVIRGVNLNELNDFAKWALPRKIDLRFIEYMPAQSIGWGSERHVGEEEVREKIQFELTGDTRNSDIQGPARRYRVDGYPGRISFISAISHSFCRMCNRLRLLSNGELVGCLFHSNSIDLRSQLRSGSTQSEVVKTIKTAVKDSEFRIIPDVKGIDYQPAMGTIGG